MLSKEGLRKLNLQELEGQLVEIKSTYRQVSSQLAVERQMQLAKTKKIRGKANKRKQELIEQILKIQKETQRVQAKIQQIKTQSNMPINPDFKIKSLSGGKTKAKRGIPKPIENTNDMNGAEMWAAIKTYKDNVKRGVIKEIREYDKLHSDEQVDYAFEMMDNKDYQKYIRLANEKAEQLEAQSIERGNKYKSGEYFKEAWPGF